MPCARTPNAEPIPGYRLLQPLGRGGFGEVWKCEAPGGIFKAIKFVDGNLNGLTADAIPAAEEHQAVERVKSIRHPFLLSMDRVEVVDGELVIVMELADKNLYDLLLEYRQAGHAGVPRTALLSYLREAAEALDLMNFQYGLQHLDVKPTNLFVVSNHVKVADFGLVSSLGGHGRIPAGAVTPIYAAPEAFRGEISPHCDQYSLAIVYQELLTGSVPFRGKNARQLMLQHSQAEPELDVLPAADRPAVHRALAKEANRRFTSCTDFVRALLAAGGEEPVRVELHSASEPRALRMTPGARGLRTTPDPRTALGDPRCPQLPGFRFLSRLATSPNADVWKAEGPDGRARLIKFIYGFGGRSRQGDEATALRLASLRHPALPPVEVLQSSPGRLVLATEFLETTLRDHFQQYRTQGLPGIPRRELLACFRAAAECLDAVAAQYGVQHLGLNPRSFFLDGERLLLADHGLAQLVWAPAGQPIGQLNTRYSAPELFDGQVSPTCDQYSLALIYQEMLTGVLPHNGQARQALARSRSRCKPGLDLLPPADREVIARALDWDPKQRWGSCLELVAALEGPDAETSGASSTVRPAMPAGTPLPSVYRWSSGPRLHAALTELVAGAAAALVPGPGTTPLTVGDGTALVQRCNARLPLAMARRRLEALRQQWNGLVLREDDSTLVLHVSRSLSIWQRLLGRQVGVELTVQLAPPQPLSMTATDVTVTIRPVGGGEEGARLLRGIGPLLFESVCTCLQVTQDRRSKERLAWPHPVSVRFVLANRELSEPVACRGKDISLTGMGFYLPPDLPTSQVVLRLALPEQSAPVEVPASIVRVQRCDDSWYEVGARFLLAGEELGVPEPLAAPTR